MSGKFLVGTSGWSYPHWKGTFYPDDLPKSRWFEYYASVFPTVEVNATFYRRFKDKTFENWRDKVPGHFRYVLKAPKPITHVKYLEDAETEIKEFWRQATILGERLGLILLQLAPKTPYDPERLRRALEAFGDPSKVAVEFRNKQWLCDEVKALLTNMNVPFCSADSPKTKLLDWTTSTYAAYIRLHGRKRWYSYDYSDDELREIAELARRMGERAESVYIFFNNDIGGYATKNALKLMELLGVR